MRRFPRAGAPSFMHILSSDSSSSSSSSQEVTPPLSVSSQDGNGSRTLPHISTHCHILPHIATCCHIFPHITTYFHIFPHIPTDFLSKEEGKDGNEGGIILFKCQARVFVMKSDIVPLISQTLNPANRNPREKGMIAVLYTSGGTLRHVHSSTLF